MSHHSQSGSIFLYILIGIALFAALGFAISRSFVKTDAVSDDKAKLIATEIINFTNQISDNLIKLRLRGCSDTQFNFYNTVYKKQDGSDLTTVNSTSPSDHSCDVFSAQGAGMTPYVVPPEGWGPIDVYSAAAQAGMGNFAVYQIMNNGQDGPAGTTAANDIVVGVAYISQKVCVQIDKILGVGTPGAEPFAVAFSGSAGSYSNGSLSSTGIMSGPEINGKNAFCRKAGSIYDFQRVLLAR